MIDIDAIERMCKEATRNGYGKHPVIECASAESLIELITRLRQAEKDAARWNYIINNSHIGGMSLSLMADYNCGVDVVTPSDAIAIVDEAMQCK